MLANILAEQEAIRMMKLAEMERYVSTRLQKTTDTARQLAFHITACQIIADTLGSEFQALQAIEKSMLDCKDRKECLSYIERNIGTFFTPKINNIYNQHYINELKFN